MKSAVEHLSVYDSYHRNIWNKATHFVGIPVVVYSLLTALSLLAVDIAGAHFSAAMGFIAIVFLYYLMLDIHLAFGAVIFLIPLFSLASASAHLSWQVALGMAAGCFVIGWIFQLAGHGIFEKNRPAFADNLIQLLIGPLYFVAECAFSLGLKKKLRDEIASRR